VSRRGKKKKKKNYLRDFKTRATCPECSSGMVTLLNKARHIFKCLNANCGHKFIYDNGVYDTLKSKTEQVKEKQEEEVIEAVGQDPLDAFFQSCKI
jgi:ssDNA-binding Zn-finger/Zn-ribbon topoisomerase 1